jgi:antitoxin MazE
VRIFSKYLIYNQTLRKKSIHAMPDVGMCLVSWRSCGVLTKLLLAGRQEADMRTTLRRIGNSQGVLIPAPLLAECGIQDEIELHLEGKKIVIEPVQQPRAGWFDGYRAEDDVDVWQELPPDADSEAWEW